jgi:hypothetical protein
MVIYFDFNRDSEIDGAASSGGTLSILKFFVSYLRAAYVQMISERSHQSSSTSKYNFLNIY